METQGGSDVDANTKDDSERAVADGDHRGGILLDLCRHVLGVEPALAEAEIAHGCQPVLGLRAEHHADERQELFAAPTASRSGAVGGLRVRPNTCSVRIDPVFDDVRPLTCCRDGAGISLSSAGTWPLPQQSKKTAAHVREIAARTIDNIVDKSMPAKEIEKRK